MSARTRTCLGCEGTGRDNHTVLPAWFNGRRLVCPACLGSGTVTEPDSRKDAMADAETVEQYAALTGWPPHEEHLAFRRDLLLAETYGRTECPTLAARSAFRAVPALKGESL
jgi:hypothetical protein